MSKDYGVNIGEEARYRKKEVLLGIGVNIYRSPLNGRNFEYMVEEPFLTSKMVVPYIQKVQQNEVTSKADIVLFFWGLNINHLQDCEGADRKE